ncbi:MAG: penicillin acylase family protein [Bacteroidetes bacterium]|nr:penicillin acylase family protein [Bacteroidota bacterium]
MRIIPFVVSTVVTAGLVFAMNKQWGKIPPMGKFLSPQHGIWQNAEPVNQSYSSELKFDGLKGKSSVYFDDRLVPHVFAENDEDLYFIQGYLHAKFRLFQMDLQTKAAAGRASEIAGSKAIEYDRKQRRAGMVYAAENAMKEMEKDPATLSLFSAYTNGINAYISSMKESELPIEYKLLNLKPEKWSNLRTALLLKMMANMLAGDTEKDLFNTNAKHLLIPDELKQLYPQVFDSLVPIVPKGTSFEKPGIVPVQPKSADSVYFTNQDLIVTKDFKEQDAVNGSNNWVVAGSKTKSGAPILCNDPHLELSLPSIWYEMQLSSPKSNVYGATLPGSPFVIIGFNDSIAWGVTNSQRDVKDYYEIKFKDNTKHEYWFNGKWEKATQKIETINVKDGATVYDTVAYTIFGPVMYDDSFRDTSSSLHRNLAVRWTAHDPSNEGIAIYHLNRAKNYDEYVNAIKTFDCPGQNFVFASKSGDIAIWQQGKFPARWKGQGLYVMPGTDSSYMWQGFIPQGENPHAKNPARGFLESANQRPADSTYPYFIPGGYITARGITIEHYLSQMNGITPEDMMKLQNNYFNTTAEDVRPILLKYVDKSGLTAKENEYLDIFKNWDLMATADSKGQTVYTYWWQALRNEVWNNLTKNAGDLKSKMPVIEGQTLLELLKRDTLFFEKGIPAWNLPPDQNAVTNSLKNAVAKLEDLQSKNKETGLEWRKFNKPGIYHLLDKSKKDLLPFDRPNLNTGGAGDIVNAISGSHGPSWRMIVQMTETTEAYGLYPGGQSGNPGSKFYDNMVDYWVEGKYYKLWFMHDADRTDKNIKWTMNFSSK